MSDKKPSEVHSDLKEAVLMDIADCILTGRESALEDYQPELGDNNWTVGTVGFSRSVHNITTLANSNVHEKLKILKDGRELVFQIGSTTWRIGRYNGFGQNRKKLRVAHIVEQLAIQEFLDFGLPDCDNTVWRFLWEIKGVEIEALYVVQYDYQENLIYSWRVPTEIRVHSTIGNYEEELAKEIKPPPISERSQEEKIQQEVGAP